MLYPNGYAKQLEVVEGSDTGGLLFISFVYINIRITGFMHSLYYFIKVTVVAVWFKRI